MEVAESKHFDRILSTLRFRQFFLILNRFQHLLQLTYVQRGEQVVIQHCRIVQKMLKAR